MYRLSAVILSSLILLSFNSQASADDAAVKKYRNYLPEEIKRLPEPLRKAELPIMAALLLEQHIRAFMTRSLAAEARTAKQGGAQISADVTS